MANKRGITVKLTTFDKQKTRQLHDSDAKVTSDLLNPIQVRYQTALRPGCARWALL